ncbi:MAG: hypothetical protein M5R40_25320 [Anaerolineae bacterium]|nr:hypothetical protein [Anaerolineae bacterium]
MAVDLHEPEPPEDGRAPLLERYQNVLLGVLVVAIFVGAAALFAGRPAPVEMVIIPPAPTPTPGPTATHAPVRVYVSGAVRAAGVYALPWGPSPRTPSMRRAGRLPPPISRA